MTYKSLKMIAVSEENYITLKRLGSAGDSFNDVITEVLKQRNLQIDPSKKTNPGKQIAATATSTLEHDYTEHE
jgi:predicted CopG family antitoxin